jgi:hypothetical protein
MRAGVRYDGADWSAVVVGADGEVVARNRLVADRHVGVARVAEWLSTGRHPIRAVTVDVSALLEPERRRRILAIRIAPRAPADAIHELAVAEELVATVRGTLHIGGGHDMRGRPLVDLDLASLRAEIAAVKTDDMVASISAVGSIANPEHEQRAADVILAAFPGARVSLSHDFFSTALRDRDFTSTANAALLGSGEELAALLESTLSRQLPGVEVSFALNDGGCAPIRRLGATPAHAVLATAGLRVQGARHLADVSDGDVAILDDDGIEVGSVQLGVPSAHSVVTRGRQPSLASNTARVGRLSRVPTADSPLAAVVVDARSVEGAPPPGVPEPSVHATDDLAALGAAVAPLSSWADFLAHAASTAELQAALRSAEEDLRSQTIHWGAAPDATRLVESNAYTFAYGSRHVVRIRARVVGDYVGVPTDADIQAVR